MCESIASGASTSTQPSRLDAITKFGASPLVSVDDGPQPSSLIPHEWLECMRQIHPPDPKINVLYTSNSASDCLNLLVDLSRMHLNLPLEPAQYETEAHVLTFSDAYGTCHGPLAGHSFREWNTEKRRSATPQRDERLISDVVYAEGWDGWLRGEYTVDELDSKQNEETLEREIAAIAALREKLYNVPRVGVVLLELVNSTFTGGLRPYFLREVHKACREFSKLLVLDETMSGLRFGHRFLFEKYNLFDYDITPDFVVFGKAYGVSGLATLLHPYKYNMLPGFVTTYGETCVFENSMVVMELFHKPSFMEKLRECGKIIHTHVVSQLEESLKPKFQGAGTAFSLPPTEHADLFGENVRYVHNRLILPIDVHLMDREDLLRALRVKAAYGPPPDPSKKRRLVPIPVDSRAKCAKSI